MATKRAWNFLDLTGDVYGRLKVTGFSGKAKSHAMWSCACECGSTVVVAAGNLRSGNTSSCGCLHRELLVSSKSRHGMSDSKEYQQYRGMLSRCRDPKSKYHRSGVRVCDRWQAGENGATGFECFMADMGPRPSASHTIERRCNSIGYEPGNCRWATAAEQNRNTSRNVFVEFRGARMVLIDAIAAAGISQSCYYRRIRRGIDQVSALSMPRGSRS